MAVPALVAPTLVTQKSQSTIAYAKFYPEKDNIKMEAAIYKIIKAMIHPYGVWRKYVFRPSELPVYSVPVSAGNWGLSIVVWMPNKGYFIHDINAQVIGNQLLGDKNNDNQKEYNISVIHLRELTLEIFSLIQRNNETDLLERFDKEFEVVILNSIMSIAQYQIYSEVENSGCPFVNFISPFDNSPYVEECYFCRMSVFICSNHGIFYDLRRCRDSYRYNNCRELIAFYHAVSPDFFLQTVEKNEEGEEETVYEFKLGKKTFELKVDYSKLKVDDCEYGGFTRGLYRCLQEKAEQSNIRDRRRRYRRLNTNLQIEKDSYAISCLFD